MGFALGSPYRPASSYYMGAGASVLTPSVVEVALGGLPLRIDWSAPEPLVHRTVPLLRQQADQSESPGEQSINPEALWRRFGESWHLGAGQEYYDRAASLRDRFHTSKNVDTWQRGALRMLHETNVWDTDAAATQLADRVGDRAYWYAGTTLSFASTLGGAFTAVTGTSATAVTSMASDGFYLWTAHGADGVYRTDTSSGAAVKIITGAISSLGFVRNRLMAADGGLLYDITAEGMATGGFPAVLPAVLHTHPSAGWAWNSFAEGNNFIYAAGVTGDRSLIYAITLEDDATALGVPTVAAQLPEGEAIVSMRGYLGSFLFLGTTAGIRLAVPSDNGALTLGAFIPTAQPVRCFEGQREFVWFGLSAFAPHQLGFDHQHEGFDDEAPSSTGLGRLSTAAFNDPQALVPAFASDLQHEGSTADVGSVITFEDHRVFTISGVGIILESEDCAPEGRIDTGRISYSMTDPKTGLFMDLQHAPDVGSFEVAVSANQGPFQSLGQRAAGVNPVPSFGLGELSASEFEFRITMRRATTDPTVCPLLKSWQFRAQPAVRPSRQIVATFLLGSELETLGDAPWVTDSYAAVEHVERLHRSKLVTTFQQESRAWPVIVEDFELPVRRLMQSYTGHASFNGSLQVLMKIAES